MPVPMRSRPHMSPRCWVGTIARSRRPRCSVGSVRRRRAGRRAGARPGLAAFPERRRAAGRDGRAAGRRVRRRRWAGRERRVERRVAAELAMKPPGDGDLCQCPFPLEGRVPSPLQGDGPVSGRGGIPPQAETVLLPGRPRRAVPPRGRAGRSGPSPSTRGSGPPPSRCRARPPGSAGAGRSARPRVSR